MDEHKQAEQKENGVLLRKKEEEERKRELQDVATWTDLGGFKAEM